MREEAEHRLRDALSRATERRSDPEDLRRELESEHDFFRFVDRRRERGGGMASMLSLPRMLALESQVAAAEEERQIPVAERIAALEAGAAELEALFPETRELPGASQALGEALLLDLADAVGLAVRAGLWPEAVRLRARYLGWWNALDTEETRPRPQRSTPDPPLGYCRILGQVVGALHGAGMVHGTLLLESFGPGGEAKNFVRGRLDAGQDPQAFAEDLFLLARQLPPAGWQAFCEAYMRENAIETAVEALRRVDALDERERERAAPLFPLAPSRLPDFVVRACAVILRLFRPGEVDFQAWLGEVEAMEDPGRQVWAAGELVLAASGIDEEVVRSAAGMLVQALVTLRSSDPRQAEMAGRQMLERVRPLLTELQAAMLTAQVELAAASLATGDAQATSLLRAARALAATPVAQLAAAAEPLLTTALENARSPDLRGEAATLLLRALVERALREQDGGPLQRALSLPVVADALPAGARETAAGYLRIAEGLLEPDPARQEELFAQAAEQGRGGSPELREMLDHFAPRSVSEDPQPEGGLALPPEIGSCLERRDWPQAAHLLRREIQRRERARRDDPAVPLLAGTLAVALQSQSDFLPHLRPGLAREALGLAERHAPALLAADGEGAAQARLATATSNLGYALSYLHAFLDDDGPGLALAVQLLERSVELSPRAVSPASFSIHANNLALAYRSRASSLHRAERVPLLERAAALLREVLEVDEELALKDDPQSRGLARSRYLDQLNLGLVAADLAEATYDATWISQKPVASAHWYREAAEAFCRSRDLAHELGEAAVEGTARSMLALLCVRLCEHYVQERTWAGGDLQGAFYDWLCTAAGTRIPTAPFVEACVRSALADAAAANRIGRERNPALLLESVDLLMHIWSLAERRQGMPADLARQTLLDLLEAFDAVLAGDDPERFGDTLAELPELRELTAALLRVELFGAVTGDLEDLREAHAGFRRLAASGGPLVRALARPRARWLEVQGSPGDLAVNGLWAGPCENGLELRIPAQRRRLRLLDLAVEESGCALRPQQELRGRIGTVVTHLQPEMSWEDAPVDILVQRLRVTSPAGGAAVLETLRLPVGGWDRWVLEIRRETGEGELAVRLSLPFLGTCDTLHGTLDAAFPALTDSPARVLLFGEQGLTFGIMAPETDPWGQATSLRVDGTPDEPVLRISGPGALVLLETTPRIASSDALFLVRDDHPLAAACGVAAFPLAAPSFRMPEGAVHGFGPLFFWENELPVAVPALAEELDLHEIVVVGLPEGEEPDQALEALWDLRRELFLLVEPAEEASAVEALDRVVRRLRGGLGRRLLTVAASSVSFVDPFETIQLVIVPRELAAAAAQMLLDMAVLRRRAPEDIPVEIEGRTTYLNLKGNSTAQRRGTTLLEGPVRWEDLTERYRQLAAQELDGELVFSQLEGPAQERIQEMMRPRIRRRPLLVLPPDPAAVLAVIPLARHLGAIVVPAGPEAERLREALRPPAVHLPDGMSLAGEAGVVHRFPADAVALALHVRDVIRQDHARLLADLPRTHPHLVSSRALLAEMEPSEYLVLTSAAERDRAWAWLAATYAAALGAPLVPFHAGPEDGEPAGSLPLPETASLPLRGDTSTVRDLLRRQVRSPALTGGTLPELCALLDRFQPRWVGLVSAEATLPLEVAGDPPLATRFAIGRLSGPDLGSTALLIARAALGEDVPRPPRLAAILAEAADALPDRPLAGAKQEVTTLYRLLAAEADVSAEVLSGEEDLERFLERLGQASLVHFAGHGAYDDGNPAASGLVFRQGLLPAEDLDRPLTGGPIIFGNACETGILRPAGGGRGWSGLAASFIAQGAVNYLGSLWPIFDEGSRRISETFYREVCRGGTVGEALLRARAEAWAEGDPTWAAFVLFGCPRNRLRSPRPEAGP